MYARKNLKVTIDYKQALHFVDSSRFLVQNLNFILSPFPYVTKLLQSKNFSNLKFHPGSMTLSLKLSTEIFFQNLKISTSENLNFLNFMKK